ncbi:MAG: hypothetical protein MJ175_12330 [Clostridia bacterium]|nr:hypothetical protein [Clostridia bacterium]
MKISANFDKITGKVKPMHGVGQPPFIGTNYELFDYLTAASVPYSRLHDVRGWFGGSLYADIPNLFRDFDADENDPASYDFTFTDHLLKHLCDAGVEPFFRLGVTIENAWALKSYRVFPPKDPAKWARICEHVVRHYNEGWADGYHMGITYWEIWNEPDDCRELGKSPMWQGTPEQYYELYELTANHLKRCFGDTIKVGGYASCGFYALSADPDANGDLIPTEATDEWTLRTRHFITFMHGFLKHITSKEHHAPIDFFSWHTYADVHTAVDCARYVRRVLANYGLDDVPDILDEWNTTPDVKGRATPKAAARVLAFMLAMQRERVAELNFYDARLGPSPYGGLFNPSTWEPYLAYYSIAAFGHAYRIGGEAESSSDDKNVFTLAAADGNEKILLIANIGSACEAEISVTGADPASREILRIDETYTYTSTGEHIRGGKLYLPANSCTEIRF